MANGIPSNAAELQMALMGMLDPDNNTRAGAERCLAQFFKNPSCVPAMVQQVCSSQLVQARQMAAVLLRRKLSSKMWRAVKQEHGKAIQGSLLQRLTSEPAPPVAKAVAALVSKIARFAIPDGEWGDLPVFLFRCLASAQAPQGQKETAMLLLRTMCEDVGASLKPHHANILACVRAGIAQGGSYEMRCEAWATMESLVDYLDTKEQVARFSALVPLTQQVVGATVQRMAQAKQAMAAQSANAGPGGGAEGAAWEALEQGEREVRVAYQMLDVLAETPVPVLDGHLLSLCEFNLKVVTAGANGALPLGVRDQALSFVQTMVETRPKQLLRRATKVGGNGGGGGGFLSSTLQACFGLTLEFHPNPFGNMSEAEATPQRLGVSLLNALCGEAPKQHVLPACLATAVEFLSGGNGGGEGGGNGEGGPASSQRGAALRAKAGLCILATIAEAAGEALVPKLPAIIGYCSVAVASPFPWVRMAVCVCIEQLADHVKPGFSAHHRTVLPVIFRALKGAQAQGGSSAGKASPQSRGHQCATASAEEVKMVRRKALSALHIFCEDLGTDIVPYVNPLMREMVGVVQDERNQPVEVRQSAIAAITSVATAAQQSFVPFFKPTLSMMMALMRRGGDEDLLLRARATECVGAVALAVGMGHFGPALPSVMELALQGMTLDFFELRGATYALVASLAQALKEKAACLLPKVMPFLLATLASDEGFDIKARGGGGGLRALGGGDDDSDDNEFNASRVNLTIRSGALDEKIEALHTLARLIEETQLRGFAPYLAKTLPAVSELLGYPHPSVRHAVNQVLHEVIEMAGKAYPVNNSALEEATQRERKVNPAALQICGQVVPLLLDTLAEESEKQVTAVAVLALQECVDSFGLSGLGGGEGVAMLVARAETLLQEKGECQVGERRNNAESEYDDDEVVEHDEHLIDMVTNLVCSLAKAGGASFAPVFRRLLPSILRYTGPRRSAYDQSMAIGCLGECVDFLGRGPAAPFLAGLWPVAQRGLRSDTMDVRRNSAYCVGSLALAEPDGSARAPGAFAATVPLLRRLYAPWRAGQPEDEAFNGCRDNACSAIAKMVLRGSHASFQGQQGGERGPAIDVAALAPLVLAGLPLRSDFSEAKYCYPAIVKLYQFVPKRMMADPQCIAQTVAVLARTLGHPEVDRGVQQELLGFAKFLRTQMGQQVFEKVMLSARLNQQEGKRFMNFLDS